MDDAKSCTLRLAPSVVVIEFFKPIDLADFWTMIQP
jgi:hypothetical protein